MSGTGWHLLCFSLCRHLIQLQPVLRDGAVLLTGTGNIRSKNIVGLSAGRTGLVDLTYVKRSMTIDMCLTIISIILTRVQ
jgi:hypothetical protein